MKNNKVVYGWFDGEECFYIGIGKPSRPYSLSGRNYNTTERRIEAESYDSFSIEVLETDLTWDQACKREIELIEQYGRADKGEGNLTNRTAGGGGTKERLITRRKEPLLKEEIDYTHLLLAKVETLEQVSTNMQAYQILLELSNPDRQIFSDYCISRRKPATALTSYLQERGVSQMGARMGEQAKTVLLKGLHPNYHKTALLSAVGQAYMDLCLAVSLAEFCTQEENVDLSYREYLSYVNKSVDYMIERLPQLIEASRMFPFSKTDQEKFPVFYSLAEGEINPKVAKKRIQNAVDILLLFQNEKIKYDDQYEDIVQQLKEYKQSSEDETFFAHVVTVLRNKDSFTDEQISHVNDVYMNRFTEEQQEYYKANIPAQTPTVAETQAFFFKIKNTKESILNIL